MSRKIFTIITSILICINCLSQNSSYISYGINRSIIVANGSNENFSYKDTQDAHKFGNDYRGQNTNDIFYKLTLASQGRLRIDASAPYYIYNKVHIHLLDKNGQRITSSTDSNCLFKYNLGMLINPGTYYIVVECENKNENENITTQIDYEVSKSIKTELEAGEYSSNFKFSHTQNTAFSNKAYTQGNPETNTNDVFYKLTLNKQMEIEISHCGSQLKDTYLNIITESGSLIKYTGANDCNMDCPQTNASIRLELPEGIYYIVSRGKYENGIITTTIEGIKSKSVVNIGEFDSKFMFSHKQNTQQTCDGFTPPRWPSKTSPNDIYYKFTLNTPMNIVVNQCGSMLDYTYAFLFKEGTNEYPIQKTSSDELNTCKDHHPSMIVENLDKGTYYVVSQGGKENGEINTYIEGIPTRVEHFLGSFDCYYWNILTQDTKNTSNAYTAGKQNDVFYRFTLSKEMDLCVNLSSINLSDINVYLLDSNENCIASNSGRWNKMSSDKISTKLIINELKEGTYYIVCEGNTSDGEITTEIKLENAPTIINLGTISDKYSYSNSQNTINCKNYYTGRPTNDIFYKFTTTKPLDIKISHCGSTINETYISLLDSSRRNCIDCSDNSGKFICNQPKQAYLEQTNVPPGTYYIVSEGMYTNGIITTSIEMILKEKTSVPGTVFDYDNSGNRVTRNPGNVTIYKKKQ